MRALRYDIVLWYGSLQRAWLNSTPSPGSHCAWLNLSRQTENTSVSANDRVLKVSAVQASCRIDPPAGPYLHQFTNSFHDHQSSTPFTRHVVPPWCLPFVSLCRTMVAGFDSRVFLYGRPFAQLPSCTPAPSSGSSGGTRCQAKVFPLLIVERHYTRHRYGVQSDTAQSRCQMFSGLGVGYPLRACPGFVEGGMERKDERE